MKTFTFRYDPKATPNDMFARLQKAAKTRVPDIQRHELSSNSISALLGTMTAVRLQLFYTIADQHPDSMYHLAQILKRDSANVIRDVKALEGIGLIKLLPEKDGERERLRPVTVYDRIVFDFGAAGQASGLLPGKKAVSQ